jgi:hypothetical protein
VNDRRSAAHPSGVKRRGVVDSVNRRRASSDSRMSESRGADHADGDGASVHDVSPLNIFGFHRLLTREPPPPQKVLTGEGRGSSRRPARLQELIDIRWAPYNSYDGRYNESRLGLRAFPRTFPEREP